MINELVPLENELYTAWLAYFEMPSGASAEQAALIDERCCATYEQAYQELGSQLTTSIINDARRATGDDI